MYRTFARINTTLFLAIFSMFIVGCELEIGIKQTNETVDSGGGDIGVPNSCGELASGETETRTRFESASVVAPASCQAELQVRVCNDGVLSDFNGSFTNASCQVVQAPVVDPPVTPPQSCGSVASGDSQTRIRYQAASVIAPASCTSETQTRLCTNGVFSAYSGSFLNTNCSVQQPPVTPPQSCGSVASGDSQTRIRYQSASVMAPAQCVSETQTRLCTDGVFSSYSGSFANANCSVTQPPVEDLTRVSDQTFKNFDLPSVQTGSFEASFSIKPLGNNIDAVIGLSQNDATGYSDMAATIRMNTAGEFDARKGSIYVADRAISYEANKVYQVRMEVHISSRTFSVFVRADGGSEQTLASNFAFRTQQANVNSLSKISMRAYIGSNELGAVTISPISAPQPLACGALASGESESRIRFLQQSVVAPAACVSETQTHTCNNGVLSSFSGSYTFSSCSVTVAPPLSCGNLASGQSTTRTRYLQSSVVSPATCVSETQTQTCNNGNLSAFTGTYTNASCSVEPAIPVVEGMNGPLKVNSQNSRYFTDNSGRAISLGGAHTWGNLPNYEWGINYESYLSELKKYNHNFIRMWAQETHVDVYLRTGPGSTNGGLKFDLTKFNQSYFDKLKQYVRRAQEEGIYVGVMLFEGWTLKNNADWDWPYHPFNKNNNINGINGDPNNDGLGMETHTTSIASVLATQKKYIEKVIDTLNEFDNVLFEISNEDFGGSAAFNWQVAMMNHIRSYEATKPKKHMVGLSCIYNGSGPSNVNSSLKSSSADWISLCGGTGSGNDMTSNPPVASAKVNFTDTDHIWAVGGDTAWIWKVFTRGYQPLYMHPWGDSEYSVPREQNAMLDAIGQGIDFAKKLNFNNMQPKQTETCNTGYCLAGGGEYLVFNPSNSTTTIKNLPAGNYSYEWLTVGSGSMTAPATVNRASTGDFSPSGRPSASHVLYMKKL